MSPERDQPDDAERLPEEAVRRLLARASELEAARTAELSVAELRDVAREAGIAPSALEQAIAELRGRPVADTATGMVPSRRFQLRSLGFGALLTVGFITAALLLVLLTRLVVP